MIIYILKSASCLALLLFFYHLVLEKEKMHHFNRYYLLIGVLFSFLAPLATITINATVSEPIIVTESYAEPITNENFISIEITENPFDYTQLIIGIYILISCIFLIRFAMNLFKIIKKIRENKKVHHLKAIVVLVEDHILPHTFWNYIFINKTAYETGTVEKELFTHELTHVTQKHTFDVLFIELLQAVFWINPLFIFLKKAIQLNHEFLADETVINTHKNTRHYQHLLLNKVAWNNEYYLASNLNYSLTKKRLKMMTKQSSKTIIWLKKLAVMPLLAGFIFLFAERVEAQKKQEIIEVQEVFSENKEVSESEIYKKYVYRNLTIRNKDKDGKIITKTYDELNEQEKSTLMPPPPLKLKKILPTKKQFEALKDKSKFAVWIDGKVVDNKVLNNYKYTDFARYSNSHVYKNARSKRFPQENQASLETHAHFEAQNNKRVEEFEVYKENEKKFAKANWQVLPNGAKMKVIEDTKNNTLKKDYIDSPIQVDRQSSKQIFSEEIPFMTTTIKAEKETNVGTVTDIRLKLKDINALKINYLKDTIPQKKSATKAQMKEYASIVAKRKKTDIFKVKEINKLKNIYGLMSSEQKKSVINVNDFIKRIPVVIPKLGSIFIYNSLNKKYESKRNRKPHFVESSKERQEELQNLFTELCVLYIKLSKEDRKKIKSPIHPHKPYIRLKKNNIVFYKLANQLTEEDKLLIPPSLPKLNATPEQFLKAQKAYEDWKKRSGNDTRTDQKLMTIPSGTSIKISDSTFAVFTNFKDIKKSKKTDLKLNKSDKKQLALRKTIVLGAEQNNSKNINYEIDGEKKNVLSINKYLEKNPESFISTKEESNGSLTLIFSLKKTKKLTYDELQTIYSKVFEKK